MHADPRTDNGFLNGWIRSDAIETLEREGLSPGGRRILDELNQVYDLTGILKRVCKALSPHIHRAHRLEGRPVRILDIGMRDGRLLRYLGDLGRREGVPLELHGVEFNPEFTRRAEELNTADSFHVQAYCDSQRSFSMFGPGEMDIVCSTFMLHHQEPADVPRILGATVRLARHSVFHLDLTRSIWGVVAIWSSFTILGMWKSRSDAVLSCRRSFRKSELVDVVEEVECATPLKVKSVLPLYLVVEADHGKEH